MVSDTNIIIDELAALGALLGLNMSGELTDDQRYGYSEEEITRAAITVAVSGIATAIKYNKHAADKINTNVNRTMKALSMAIKDGILNKEGK